MRIAPIPCSVCALLTCLVLAPVSPAHAQSGSANPLAAGPTPPARDSDTSEQRSAERPGTGGSVHRLGLELSPISPLIRVFPLRATYSIWQYGDVVGGYVYQDERITDVGRARRHSAVIGYRQFFWHGLHAEAELWAADDAITSYVDGKRYHGLELWGNLSIGYRLDVFEHDAVDLFVLPLLEAGYPLYREDPPPEISNDPFVVPVIWLGARAL